MSREEEALEIQEKIGKLIDKLSKLGIKEGKSLDFDRKFEKGFEFMYHNSISSIRQKRGE